MYNSKSKLLFTKEDFDRVRATPNIADKVEELSLIADMTRHNTLATIAYAKSGHIGASLSAIEMFTALYHNIMKYDAKLPWKQDRDVFILSKGHAAAGLYATLASAGFFSEEKLLTFRKFGGLQGHVDISTPGVDANTGSLGMGISKAKGYAWASKANGLNSSAYVMVGDGEMQEGQNWEAIQSAAHLKLDNLYLIVDANKIQTDREVSKINDLRCLEDKLEAFGWAAISIDGNNVEEILRAFGKLKKISDKPKAIVSNTLKGKGISFMEHPAAMAKDGVYRWHGAISNPDDYRKAYVELTDKISNKLQKFKVDIQIPQFYFPDLQASGFFRQALKPTFSDSLVELGTKNKNIVVLDADLEEDCGLSSFAKKFPDRFIEVGIAEQDLVSMAGGLAAAGKLPIVNTYAAFLTSRANEQIFNNASESRKIIYVGHLAGILPGKPGKSHQGIRDISLLKSIPNLLLCQPCNTVELKQLMNYLVDENPSSSYMRLEHVLPKNDISLPRDYKVSLGKGVIIEDGKDAAIISYGAIILSEALLAREQLAEKGISAKVINLPWLNKIDSEWLSSTLGFIDNVFCVENHSVIGGQAEELRRIRSTRSPKINTIGVEGFGQSGDNEDILKHYELDAHSIAKNIAKSIKKEIKQ